MKTPPLPFHGCNERLFKHMTVHSDEPGVRPYPPPLETSHPEPAADATHEAAMDCLMSDSGDSPARAAVATGPWSGLPPMSAPIELFGDCKDGLGPQDHDRWRQSVPVDLLLCSLSMAQQHELMTAGWQALVKAGKPLPECAKWNATPRDANAPTRPARVCFSLPMQSSAE